MNWQAELRKLLPIQDLDREIDALSAERQGLLGAAQEMVLERELHARRTRASHVEAELAATERQQRLAELERQSQEVERERATRRLYGGEVRAPRDLEGLQKNIAGSEQRISDLETTILEAMEQADTLRQRLQTVRAAVTQAAAVLEKHRQTRRQRLAALDGRLPLLVAQRDTVAARVDGVALREYGRVRRGAHDGVGVVRAESGRCTGCQVEFAPLVRERLRDPEQRVTCEHCGRLLVVE